MIDNVDRLRHLASCTELEPAEEYGCPKISPRQQDAINVSSAQLPNGKRIIYLKTLLSSACERNCFYCPFRAGRDFRRASLKPDEMASLFIAMHRAGLVEGLFLSSGVTGGGVHTQDQMIATAEILRKRYQFDGYLHLKLMPGAERDQVESAMRLADRVSLNLEAPNTQRLGLLAPRKAFLEELIQPLRWVEEIRRTQPDHHGWKGRWPSMTTQFVVGAVGESDLELLKTTEYLHNRLHLGRAYFSAFHPIHDTPFEDRRPANPVRQQRLYQASFLLRDYGFAVEDLPFAGGGDLPLEADPKLSWARTHLAQAPVEINRAERGELLRVPGIGPKAAAAILVSRRKGRLTSVDDLRRLGIRAERASPYILLDGHRPPHQLSYL